ncbi:hypothetical protein [Streptomyces sp. TLI_171]|uniref:hypothetical protein n=1 Tax=Streptomyces sp. TLI_171 TaxID=1938859 RepID=UPI000C18F708|nr:hypothetical protein [Streptomyces sp. TLI_171]RKE02929.1 hypothetical protein BX266_7532 [Streptomyces sp. TLI_171]
MRQLLLRFLPDRLTRRLGYDSALLDLADVATALEDNVDRARVRDEADHQAALRKLTGPLEFQPGLLALHEESAEIVGYLCGLAAAAETNLDRTDPGQRALCQALLEAITASEELRNRVAVTALLALPKDSALQPS